MPQMAPMNWLSLYIIFTLFFFYFYKLLHVFN